jgi:hypothetical protein
MADLKISQLPTASILANTDLLPIKTTAGTKAITFEDLKASQEGYFKRVIAEYMQFDYEELTAMRADGVLIAGQKYLLTDYQTVYRQDRGAGTYVGKISAVEPLILTAVSTNEFSQVAYSPSYPQDIIWYNFDNVLSPDNASLFYNSVDRISKGFKGIIIRRIDTQKNIDYSYDWRTLLWWREGNEVLTFGDLSNVYNVVSGSNCYNNTFGNYCSGNTFGNYCFGNTFGNSCSDNTFGNYCSNNTFGSGCYNNTFDDTCLRSIFGNGCQSNTFGVSWRDNTVGNNCHSNAFGDSCSNNTFGNSCYRNTFGDYLKNADVKGGFGNATVTNPAIYDKEYNHTFYEDSSGAAKCYCINSSGAITNVPLGV